MKPMVAFCVLLASLGTAARAGEAEPVAVVELFTSEGCSSCPPADQLLSEIASDARGTKRRVFALAFHVDYWNRLGWADPFSSKLSSQRQQAYATRFRSRQVYTPQAVVNGSVECVGSDRARLKQHIDAALARAASVTVILQPTAGRDTLSVAWEVAPVSREGVLNIALVERDLSSKVPRGENAGRTLRHDNVVRTFQTVSLDGKGRGRAELECPAGVVRGKSSLIGYVQDVASLGVLGAVEVALRSGGDR